VDRWGWRKRAETSACGGQGSGKWGDAGKLLPAFHLFLCMRACWLSSLASYDGEKGEGPVVGPGRKSGWKGSFAAFRVLPSLTRLCFLSAWAMRHQAAGTGTGEAGLSHARSGVHASSCNAGSGGGRAIISPFGNCLL
jgi:hypothetical protein